MLYKIYTRDLCDFCVLAKRLLEKHNLPFEEYNLESHPHHRDELKEKIPDAKTVPQIFVSYVFMIFYFCAITIVIHFS